MTAKHTQGKWFVDEICRDSYSAYDSRVAGIGSPDIKIGLVTWQGSAAVTNANAARIVACVNACDGFEDPAEAIRLLSIEAARAGAVDALRAENARLREALQALIQRANKLDQSGSHDGLLNCEALGKARNALKGGNHA